jgi:hypothetical protein
MRTTTPTQKLDLIPEELPVLHYERLARRLRAEAEQRLADKWLEALLNFWTSTGPALMRETRLRALQPDTQKPERARDLGLEPFLNLGIR